ncbi:SGNH/GDSL hydrolase family protein [Nocardioides immobilis]|uniref:SGNH/GDSL hydrolase family protein n=1 Tax=Nocardioides immobilis TaxID=2049295 RepID=A0A417Y662_9ACTN|nr:SGNH/GDSL hydrolase family protein [Nocardioides immobilis]RHW28183.1 SGNH/GDSL hydrolase family protein [Nocardioides immobilis]
MSQPEWQERPYGGTPALPTADYVRFAVLGDSASCGVGDPTSHGWRGWARILSDAIAVDHHVSLCNLAVPGAVVADVRRKHLDDAVAHRPVVASLVVGLNDVLRSGWDPEQIREDLLHCAGALARHGALVVTVRFHDHTRVLGIPGPLARPLRRRIQTLNDIYDEVHEQYGALRLDLAADPAIYSRDLWSFDRLHPSELGHRWLARRVADLLTAEGLLFPAPSLTCTSAPLSRREQVRTLAIDVAPWLGRRIRDLAPRAAREAVHRTRGRLRLG